MKTLIVILVTQMRQKHSKEFRKMRKHETHFNEECGQIRKKEKADEEVEE